MEQSLIFTLLVVGECWVCAEEQINVGEGTQTLFLNFKLVHEAFWVSVQVNSQSGTDYYSGQKLLGAVLLLKKGCLFMPLGHDVMVKM